MSQTEIETSRAKLLDALGDSPDVVFIRAYGNLGDDLIYAGTRQLLAGMPYREVSMLNLADVRGHTALIAGSGGWCQPYQEMPRFLAPIEERFERVIILPSSFDVSVESVRHALAKTRARVFAREAESYRQIQNLCAAELAHDCAFFFDYTPYRQKGAGILNAFRTDKESALASLPNDNRDISIACSSLDDWLWTIARHQIIRTDRAHVMIAAALLGKQVEYCASNYHKVPAIAEYALRQFPVTRIPAEHCAPKSNTMSALPAYATEATVAPARTTEETRAHLMARAQANRGLLPRDFWERQRELNLTIVMLSHGRLDQTLNALRALKENVAIPFKLLLIDNGSGRETQAQLQRAVAQYDFAELILLDENLGCPGGRTFALSRVTTEYVMFLDNDIEVLPGAVEHLLDILETRPHVSAVAGTLVLPNGRILVCGGDFAVESDVLRIVLLGFGQTLVDAALGKSGNCRWVNGGSTMFRPDVLRKDPLDAQMRVCYDDLEWCYRVQQSNALTFYRCVEAIAIHYHEFKVPLQTEPREQVRQRGAGLIEAMAHFYQKHGKVIQNLFDFVPELGAPNEASVSAAKLFLELVNARGMTWVLEKWNARELDSLFGTPPWHAAALEQRIQDLVTLVVERQQAVEVLGAQLAAQTEKVNMLVAQVVERQQAVETLTTQLAAQTEKVNMARELDTIHTSKLWKLVSLWRSLLRRLR